MHNSIFKENMQTTSISSFLFSIYSST